jgi:hypothetical protein
MCGALFYFLNDWICSIFIHYLGKYEYSTSKIAPQMCLQKQSEYFIKNGFKDFDYVLISYGYHLPVVSVGPGAEDS